MCAVVNGIYDAIKMFEGGPMKPLGIQDEEDWEDDDFEDEDWEGEEEEEES